MNRREQIIVELNRLARVAESLSARQVAYMELHKAACLNQDAQEMAQRRDELHTILDSLLDNGESIHLLSYELETLP